MKDECAILVVDYGMYVSGWDGSQCHYTVDVREAKKYGVGQQLIADLQKLRKIGLKVTTTDEEMGWL